MRKQVSYTLKTQERLKDALLHWSQQFDEVAWLDSNSHKNKYSSFDVILAVDALTVKKTDAENAFNDIKEYQNETKDWLFGYLSYDLKNDIERLNSNNFDGLSFPDLFLFQPKKIIRIQGNILTFDYLNMVDDEIQDDYEKLLNDDLTKELSQVPETNVRIRMRIFKDEYFRKVQKMLDHIY